VEITKHYYKDQVDQITQELEQAQGRGPAAAEEWSKGLEFRGKKRMRTAETWERWEIKFQLWLNQSAQNRSISSVTPASSAYRRPSGSPARHIPSPLKHSFLPPCKHILISFQDPVHNFYHDIRVNLIHSSHQHSTPSCTSCDNTARQFYATTTPSCRLPTSTGGEKCA
jgi:hypothetical protein